MLRAKHHPLHLQALRVTEVTVAVDPLATNRVREISGVAPVL